MYLIAGCHKLVPGHYKCINIWSRYHCDRLMPFKNMHMRRCRDNQDQAMTSSHHSSMAHREEFYVFCVYYIIMSQSSQKHLLLNNYIT